MRRALLCACSDYRDTAFTPLKYPLNDIEEIKHLLEEPELCAFEEIELLANPGRGEAHEAVEHLTADSGQDDLILFYFSGHGKLAQDGSVALVLNDTKENRLHSTGLLDDQLRALFNASRARQRVIILDCCYSGAVGEEGFKRASGDAVEAMAQQIKGTFILTASSKFQPAMECNEARGSAFTSCLVEGVRSGAAAEKDTGCVTLSKLGEYLAREVPLRSSQQPKFWDFGGVGGTVLARVPSRYDAKWTEATLKRLRQLMGREQIDDALFVELQQVLRRPAGTVTQERLALIEELAQKRMKPLAFLRQWQALAAVESAAVADMPPGAEETPVRSFDPSPQEAAAAPPEPKAPPAAETVAESRPTMRDAPDPISSDERPPPVQVPPPRHAPPPPGESARHAPPVAEPVSRPSAPAGRGVLDLFLVGGGGLIGLYALAGGQAPVVLLVGLLLFIGIWTRLWQQSAGGLRLLLIIATLGGGFLMGMATEVDPDFAFLGMTAFLWGFGVVLMLKALQARSSG